MTARSPCPAIPPSLRRIARTADVPAGTPARSARGAGQGRKAKVRALPLLALALLGMTLSACGAGLPNGESAPLASAVHPADLELSARTGGELVKLALDRQDAIHEAAIAELRGRGPSSLVSALAAMDADAEARWAPASRWQHVIGEIAGQRDADVARVFWFTDLEAAKAEARATGRPILSLRLLGDLREEFSCANSRLFRAVLYADPAVGGVLRDRFVLHWSSERAVPRVTIDYGDGRRLERTITGNSVHYVLTAEGEVIDALPGMYDAQTFAWQLAMAAGVAAEIAADPSRRAQIVAENHTRQLNDAVSAARWSLSRLRRGAPEQWNEAELREWMTSTPAARQHKDREAKSAAIAASEAMVLTIGKMAMERPVLDAVGQERRAAAQRWGLAPTEVELRALAARDGIAALSDPAWQVIDRQKPLAHVTDAQTREVKAAVLRAAVARSAAEDRVLNEWTMRPVIHAWLAADPNQSMETLNRRIYDELFLTPAADPWLGLLDDEVYVGLERGGVVLPPPADDTASAPALPAPPAAIAPVLPAPAHG